MTDTEYILPDKKKLVAGVDEVARGTFIGPVISACVVLPVEFPDENYKQIKDSKKLSEKKREFLANYIKENCITYGIGEATSKEIDDINILNATIKAMHRAIDVAYKKTNFDYLVIDGPNFKPYIPPGYDNDIIEYECVPKGDSKYLSIAAASILAKDYHTKYIKNLVANNDKLLLYDIQKNKGYGTKKHHEAIFEHGLTEFHRKTFGICRNYSTLLG